jgi:signal transduction histidine kinase
MDRFAVELPALGFQALITALLSLVYVGLWHQRRQPYYATWGIAWALYAARLVLISAFLVTRREIWLFAHQAATGLVALLLLWAALQFSQQARWRWRYAWLGVIAIAWAWFTIEVIRNPAVAGISSVALLSGVTLWTGVVFWNHRRRVRSTGALVLALTFTLWGFHHLDYPLLRFLGTGVLYGVFADVVFIVAAAVGTLFLVLGTDRRSLEVRNAQLEQLTSQLLRAQEDERRRIARELHDEAGQVLTAVKIELDLEGRREASDMVARAMTQLRDLSNLLRPVALDELGLIPALRGMVEDFGARTQVRAELECSPPRDLPPEHEVVIYRVVQEALTNVARHAEARSVRVRLAQENGCVRVSVEDDGRGSAGDPAPRLGLMGMRERVTALGGDLLIRALPGEGFRLEAEIPVGET